MSTFAFPFNGFPRKWLSPRELWMKGSRSNLQVTRFYMHPYFCSPRPLSPYTHYQNLKLKDFLSILPRNFKNSILSPSPSPYATFFHLPFPPLLPLPFLLSSRPPSPPSLPPILSLLLLLFVLSRASAAALFLLLLLLSPHHSIVCQNPKEI